MEYVRYRTMAQTINDANCEVALSTVVNLESHIKQLSDESDLPEIMQNELKDLYLEISESGVAKPSQTAKYRKAKAELLRLHSIQILFEYLVKNQHAYTRLSIVVDSYINIMQAFLQEATTKEGK